MSEKNIYQKENNEIIQKKIWILETDGTNLYDIFNSKFVDYTKTISNDIIEIYEILGIEAVRQLLNEQVTDVIQHEGCYINSRHIDILCDIMTNKGFINPINRQGISRGDVGPLAKCSFEDTTDQLFKAGIFGEKDNLKGVSSNIMMGQVINAGTGLCNLFIDENKLTQELENIQLTEKDFIEVSDKNIDVLLKPDIIEDQLCNDINFKFSYE